MPLIIDMSDDIYYLKGYEEGFQKGFAEGFEIGQLLAKYTYVSNCLKYGNFTKAQIANLVDVSASFIKKVEQELAKKANAPTLLKSRLENEAIAKKAGVSVEFVEYIQLSLKKKAKS